MSVESFIRAIPKVELNLQLEGVIPRETLLMLADQNEMRDQVKKFDKWLELYENPDFKKLDDLTNMLRSWIQYGDDLTRSIYDIGVALSKDNVRYAEITINPLSFVTGDLTFDEFIEAINDGRDRAERAWGVQMRWIMAIPRAEPRFADEVARWATSTTARDGGVVAIALVDNGGHTSVSLDQFERAFRTAAKKDLDRVAYLGPKDDVDEAIDLLQLQAVVDAWGITESIDTLQSLPERDVNLCVGLARAKQYGWIREIAEYPIATLSEHETPFVVSTDMPVIFRQRLHDEYLALYQHNMLTVPEIEALAMRSLSQAHLPDDEKGPLQAAFKTEYSVLRQEHLDETAADTNST